MDGTVLDTWFPYPELGEFETTGIEKLSPADPEYAQFAELIRYDEARRVDVVAVRTTIADLSAAARGRARRVPAAAPALAPAGRPRTA